MVKILHPVAIPKTVEIWQSATLEYEKEHPEVKIQFDYLENESVSANSRNKPPFDGTPPSRSK